MDVPIDQQPNVTQGAGSLEAGEGQDILLDRKKLGTGTCRRLCAVILALLVFTPPMRREAHSAIFIILACWELSIRMQCSEL
jgi:hypothetical protein